MDNITECWRELGRAIVKRALHDYKSELSRSFRARKSQTRRYARIKAENIEDFLCGRGFYDGWCEMLYPEVNGKYLAREVKRIVTENYRSGRIETLDAENPEDK